MGDFHVCDWLESVGKCFILFLAYDYFACLTVTLFPRYFRPWVLDS